MARRQRDRGSALISLKLPAWALSATGVLFSVGVGYGDGLAGEVHAGWGGWAVSAQRDRAGETYLLRKTWEFF